MLELFPSRYFHLGADEVPEDAWQSSPLAKALSEKLGTEGAAPLQAHLLKRLQGFLLERFPSLADSTSTIRQTLAEIGAAIQARGGQLAQGLISSAWV